MKPVAMFDLEAMKNVDVRTIDPATLVDIRDIHIDPTRSVTDRIKDYLRQCGENAYCFRCGDVIVKVEHSQTERTMGDCMEGFWQSL